MDTTRITLNPADTVAIINPNIYGHFAEHLGRCIYDGIWVGEDSPIPNIGGFRRDVIEALRRLKPPVIRWPGGCFADDYHWQDGIGPRDQRPRRCDSSTSLRDPAGAASPSTLSEAASSTERGRGPRGLDAASSSDARAGRSDTVHGIDEAIASPAASREVTVKL